MSKKRDELIKSALMAKLSGGIDIYTADDILTAADISDAELQEFREKVQADIHRLAEKKK